MKSLFEFIKRNCKLFFKDKGLVFSSMITPIILLVLYVSFLKRVYEGSFEAYVPKGDLLDALVGGQLVSSLLAVVCITVSFSANLIMVNDRVSGTLGDFLVTPLGGKKIAFGYFVATAAVSLIICFTATILCFIYLGAVGWYLSVGDVFLTLADVFILVLFGTALSSVVYFFLNTNGQVTAVQAIICAGYGFLCGAYMPLSACSDGLRNALMFLPGTYATNLIRNHAMNGAFDKLISDGMPEQAVTALKDSVDCNIYFFNDKVELWVSYLVISVTVILLISAYVLINSTKIRRNS